MPMIVNPYESPQTAGRSAERRFVRLKRVFLGCLGILGVLALLIALLLPATRSVREPARRNMCSNNLKQIGLALLNYEAVYHALPPAYTVDADGNPLHSWRTLILPYMERDDLYREIDLSKAWDDPANSAAFATPLYVYRCPSADCAVTHTTYLAVVAPNGCFPPGQVRKLAEITDDPNLTLMVVDAPSEQAVHWMCPTDATESQILNLGSVGKLAHPGAVQAVSVAGSVLLLRADSSSAKLRALVSIAGNDDAVAGAD